MSSQRGSAKFGCLKPDGKKPSLPQGPRNPPSNPTKVIRDPKTHSNTKSKSKTMVSQDIPRFEFHKIRAEERWPRSLGPRLAPGETILDIDIRPGLARPDGWDMYYLGTAGELDFNASPAVLGMPSSRMGYYNINEGTSSVVCPMCFQSFTTTVVLETGHCDLGGPCEKFQKSSGILRRVVPKKEKVVDGVEWVRFLVWLRRWIRWCWEGVFSLASQWL